MLNPNLRSIFDDSLWFACSIHTRLAKIPKNTKNTPKFALYYTRCSICIENPINSQPGVNGAGKPQRTIKNGPQIRIQRAKNT